MIKQFIPRRIRIEKDKIVRIHRVIQGKGEIFVKPNQEVKPADIIASSNFSSGFRTLNLADLLSVNASDAAKFLKRAIGQRIYKGELLAFKDGGLFGGKKTVVAPTDGVLEYLNPSDGELKITLMPKKVELPAGVFGIVEAVDVQRGKVIIRTQVSRIHGVFGSGRMRDGILEFVGKREDLIGGPMISPKSEGHILVGGSLIYKEALSAAISCGIVGFITGGLNANDYKSMAGGRIIFPKKLENDIGISVVACEGFGSIPIAEDIYNLLRQYDNRFVTIDGNAAILNLPSFESSSLIKIKATSLPPQDISYETLSQPLELKLGVKVRVVGSSYLGEQGKVVSIDESPTRIQSGLSVYLATVETSRRKIKVPVVNLELIEYI